MRRIAGLAIAIGVMVDASLVMVENAHKHLERSRVKGRESRVGLEETHDLRPTTLDDRERTRAVIAAAQA